MNLLNGCCGVFSNVVVSCPVTGFGAILPATLIMIPRAGSFATTYNASNDPPGCSGSANGLSYGVATYTAPGIFSVISGVSISIDPIFDSGGTAFARQRGARFRFVLLRACTRPRPEPAPGLTVIPSGSVTVVFFRFDGRERERVFPCLRDDERDVQPARGFRGARPGLHFDRRVRTARGRIRRSGRLRIRCLRDSLSGSSHESASILAREHAAARGVRQKRLDGNVRLLRATVFVGADRREFAVDAAAFAALRVVFMGGGQTPDRDRDFMRFDLRDIRRRDRQPQIARTHTDRPTPG